MTRYSITIRRGGKTENHDIEVKQPWGDDRDAIEALLSKLDPDERAPYGLVAAKNRGERPNPPTTDIDVLKKYDIVSMMYSVDGGEQIFVLR